MGKNPINYEKVRKETNLYEQKPISIDDFNELEESSIKEQIEKRKKRKREVAENYKLLRKKQKAEENKVKEERMWARIPELNGELKNIKNAKKESKNPSKTIINYHKNILFVLFFVSICEKNILIYY